MEELKMRQFLTIFVLAAIFVVMVINDCDAQGVITRRFRTYCYTNKQLNCSKKFIDVYPELSRSANNLSVAETHFWLFTNKNQQKPEWLDKCGGSLPPNTNFNAKYDLVVIINPFIAGICDFAIYREWMAQIFQKGKYNILAVDWSWGSKAAYHTSIANGKIAAKQTVKVLQNIQDQTGIKKEQISIVGHSLAAHVAGWVGMEFPVGRITGLDPAGPAFHNNVSINERLDPTDADFVDVWHCNAGDCLPYLGINYDAGDVDFWIDGGVEQSTCRQNILPSILKGDFIYAFENITPNGCSHVHCAQYYKMSINPGNCQYVGVKCDSWEEFKAGKCHRCGENGENCMIMGFDTLKSLGNRTLEYSERYYVQPSNKCPYCDNSKLALQGFKKTYKTKFQ